MWTTEILYACHYDIKLNTVFITSEIFFQLILFKKFRDVDIQSIIFMQVSQLKSPGLLLRYLILNFWSVEWEWIRFCFVIYHSAYAIRSSVEAHMYVTSQSGSQCVWRLFQLNMTVVFKVWGRRLLGPILFCPQYENTNVGRNDRERFPLASCRGTADIPAAERQVVRTGASEPTARDVPGLDR